MTKPEFNVGDRVAWNYGIGKGKGHILQKVTKTTKFAGKNFKASPDKPKYLIKSDRGKELLRNPETLEMLLKEDVVDGNGNVTEAQGVTGEDPTANVEGVEKKEEIRKAVASQDGEIEAKGTEEKDEGCMLVVVRERQELRGGPLQQIPGVEEKPNHPQKFEGDEHADLRKGSSKAEVQQGAANGNREEEDGVEDVKMDQAKQPSNCASKEEEEEAPTCVNSG